jgi:KUP system potassium uptake protein
VVIQPVSERFARVILVFGFMDEPNVPQALMQCRKMGVGFDAMATSFFLSRRVVRPAATGSAMPRWRDKLFIWLMRNANDATEYFRIPTSRVVEIGTQLSI